MPCACIAHMEHASLSGLERNVPSLGYVMEDCQARWVLGRTDQESDLLLITPQRTHFIITLIGPAPV
jgi:hypothetical protein